MPSTSRDMFDPGEAWGRGQLPNFGPDEPDAADRAIRIPTRGLKMLGEKIVRGWTYRQTGRLIGPEYEIEVSIIADDRSEPVRELIKAFGAKHERGPGVAIYWAPAAEDPVSWLFIIELWGRLKLYAAVAPR